MSGLLRHHASDQLIGKITLPRREQRRPAPTSPPMRRPGAVDVGVTASASAVQLCEPEAARPSDFERSLSPADAGGNVTLYARRPSAFATNNGIDFPDRGGRAVRARNTPDRDGRLSLMRRQPFSVSAACRAFRAASTTIPSTNACPVAWSRRRSIARRRTTASSALLLPDLNTSYSFDLADPRGLPVDQEPVQHRSRAGGERAPRAPNNTPPCLSADLNRNSPSYTMCWGRVFRLGISPASPTDVLALVRVLPPPARDPPVPCFPRRPARTLTSS